MNKQIGLKVFPKLIIAIGCSILFATPAAANSVYVAVDNFEYKPDLGNFNLNFNPIGTAIGGSFDINDQFSLQAEWGHWKDDDKLMGISTADFKSTLLNFGVNYKTEDWTLSAMYRDISDDIDLIHGNAREFHSSSKADLMSLRLTAALEKKSGDWAYYLEGGLQYDEADTLAIFDQNNRTVKQKDEALFSMAKFGGDYYIPGGGEGSWFLGGNLSWYQKVTSDVNTTDIRTGMGGAMAPPPPIGGGGGGRGGGGGNGGGGTNVNRTFGDSFGLLGVYGTYQFNEQWSLDWTSSFGFAGERNANSHALTLSFSFK